MLKILAALPAEIAAGMMVVSFSRKSTKENPVEEKDKFRCVLVPAYSYKVTAEPMEAQDAFSDAISEVVNETAGEILKAYCIANTKDGKLPEEISDDMLTFSAVLTKMQEQQTGERLNGEQIGAWYDASATKQEAAKRYGEESSGQKKQAVLRAKYLATASNNPGIDAALATKMLGYIAEQDLSNAVCRAVVKKLERLTKQEVSSDEL